MAQQWAQQKICGERINYHVCSSSVLLRIADKVSSARRILLSLTVRVCLPASIVYVRGQDVAKEHKKDVHFEIDVVEDLLPVDVDEGVWAWRGEETEGQEG